MSKADADPLHTVHIFQNVRNNGLFCALKVTLHQRVFMVCFHAFFNMWSVCLSNPCSRLLPPAAQSSPLGRWVCSYHVNTLYKHSFKEGVSLATHHSFKDCYRHLIFLRVCVFYIVCLAHKKKLEACSQGERAGEEASVITLTKSPVKNRLCADVLLSCMLLCCC